MNPIKKVMTAGLVAAALGVVPALVSAQEPSGTGSAETQSQTTGSSTTGAQSQGTQPSSQGQQQAGGGGADQEAVRQHLAAARQSLAELTQLPAAGKLEGEQRTRISDFISHFNEFATATTDWREKYEKVDQSLDGIIGEGAAPGAAAAGSTPAQDPASGAAGNEDAAGAAAGGSFDPSIIAKLRETRQHLDEFELATGDPGFVADRIERILDAAAGSAGGATTGTSGATGTAGQVQGSGASATGMVTLSQSQLEDIRRHLERLRRR